MDTTATRPATGRSVLAGVLIGVGVAAFLDETVFHQLLHWHHFYDGAGLEAGLPVPLRRRATVPKRVWAGGFLGWGVFQVYDGLFQHKVLGLHQIRYEVDLLPYDLAWNISGAVGAEVGVVLLLGPARPIAGRAEDGA